MSQEHGSRAGLPWLWGPQTCTELPSPALCALSCIVLPRVPAGEARGSAGGLLGAAADGCALGRGGEAGSACAGSGLCCSADPCLQLWLCPRSTVMELREPEARHRGLRGVCVQAGGSAPCLHVGPRCQRCAETPGSSKQRPRAAPRCHRPHGHEELLPAAVRGSGSPARWPLPCFSLGSGAVELEARRSLRQALMKCHTKMIL